MFRTVVLCRLRSTTSGPHFDPHDIHFLRHMTQMNELKMDKDHKWNATLALLQKQFSKFINFTVHHSEKNYRIDVSDCSPLPE